MKRTNSLLVMVALFLLALAACTPVPTPDPLPTTEADTVTEPTAVPATETEAEPEAVEPAPEDLVLPEQPSQTDIDAQLAELELEVLTAGDGAQPEVGDVVVTHVIITTEDGEVVFNSYELGDPIRFPYGVDVMFPLGLDAAVGRMSIGETTRFTLPAAIGFGPDGSGLVAPGSTVIMEVELVSIPQIELIIEEEGDGPVAELGDILFVHYTGTLEDGTEFDSSLDRGEPIQLVLGAGQVIPGWEMGLEGLTEGTTARFIIPPELAYGSADQPGIPGNSTLIFEIELVEVQKTPIQQ